MLIKLHLIKARLYNPGELASKLASIESGTPPPIPSVLRPKLRPHNLNAHLGVGLSRQKEMPEHDATIQLNLVRSRQEVKCRNNKQHPVTFQNKTLRADTAHVVRPAVYCTALWRTQTATIGDYRRAEQNWIWAAMQRTVSSGNWADSLAILMAKKNTQRS